MRFALNGPHYACKQVLRMSSQYAGLTTDGKVTYSVFPDQPVEFSLGPCRQSGVCRVYVYMETPNIVLPAEHELRDVDVVISPFDLPVFRQAHLRWIQSFPLVPWFYGIDYATNAGTLHVQRRVNSDLDALSGMPCPHKPKLLSLIVSGKCSTKGHRWRHYLASELKAYFGNQIDVFGFGHNPVPDKKLAIDPYQYSIVIENDDFPFYATEKVVDALLGWSLPIYAGAGNLDACLEQSLPRLSFGCGADQAIAQIKAILQSSPFDAGRVQRLRAAAITKLNLLEALPRLISA